MLLHCLLISLLNFLDFQILTGIHKFCTFSFDKTVMPFNFSIKLYDIHNCSNVSDSASRPEMFLIKLRPSDNILRFSKCKIKHPIT